MTRGRQWPPRQLAQRGRAVRQRCRAPGRPLIVGQPCGRHRHPLDRATPATGYTVKGRIAVNTRGRDWRKGDRRYGRGWSNDYRGWNDSLRGYDAGNFTCKVSYNGRTSVDFSGIRGL